VCRSFVWYGTQHANDKLAGKCFAITAESWSPAYELHVTSGVFKVGGMGDHDDEADVPRRKGPAALAQGEPIVAAAENARDAVTADHGDTAARDIAADAAGADEERRGRGHVDRRKANAPIGDQEGSGGGGTQARHDADVHVVSNDMGGDHGGYPLDEWRQRRTQGAEEMAGEQGEPGKRESTQVGGRGSGDSTNARGVCRGSDCTAGQEQRQEEKDLR